MGLAVFLIGAEVFKKPDRLGENAMKTTLFLLLFLCATAALGQQAFVAPALSNEAQPLQMISHPGRAEQHPMATAENLLNNSAYASAQGERPLWEVAPTSTEIPLGDIARALKQEHLTAKKADFVRND
jgi:hypothetical protein